MASADCNGEDEVVNLVDVLAEQDALEQDALAVLGGADDSTCSYSKGYVKRQPLYACVTCADLNNLGKAGVCFGCSMNCHDGHELVELYTKRNFRCDCGNSKFGSSFKCVLFNEKAPLNELNEYNQNFDGKYCVCHLPYPDPDNDEEDEMYQCIVCEDWYHGRHVGIEDDEFSEFICPQCADKLSFLRCYSNNSIKADTSVVECNDFAKNVENSENVTRAIDSERSASVKSKTGETCSTCVKPSSPSGDLITSGPIFCHEKWRESLCRCESCMAKYEEHKCEFLLDKCDTIESYEEAGKASQSVASGVDPVEKMLNQLDRFQQVELLHGYNTLKEELLSYLSKFTSSGKVVREEDIREFFVGLESNKRRRISDDHE